ncbi:MAG: response regulator [Candidatus Omnitrophica bacterium]|nr:response regulator [Candidatus Omnitrophota bacterium]
MKKILIVDDEVKFGEVVKLNLESTGNYTVQAVSEPKTCLAAMRTFKPDVILLDILMPEIWGYDIAGAMMDDPHLRLTPVIFVSALVKQGQKEIYGGLIRNRPFYAQPTVSKPVKTAQLIQAIESSLIRKELFLKDPTCQKCKNAIDHINDAEVDQQDPETPKLIHPNCDRAWRDANVRE